MIKFSETEVEDILAMELGFPVMLDLNDHSYVFLITAVSTLGLLNMSELRDAAEEGIRGFLRDNRRYFRRRVLEKYPEVSGEDKA